jgi:hypothetical protein
MTTRDDSAPPDQGAVTAKTRELVELEKRDRNAFAEALADNIMEPDPIETDAFRSDELAFQSLAAARYLIDNANSVMNRRRRGSREQRGTERFLQMVGRERRILENVVNGIRARKGMLPNAPNPRQRALRRLATENLAGDVPRGRFRDLVIEEQQVDKDRKYREKKERQAARRAHRDGD